VLGWEPEVSLEQGLAYTYAWVEAQVRARLERTGKTEII
jgi:nucleoside-diphosphate-sugar epimerase